MRSFTLDRNGILLLLSLLWIFALLGGCSAKYFIYRVPHKEPVPLDCQDVENIHIPPGSS